MPLRGFHGPAPSSILAYALFYEDFLILLFLLFLVDVKHSRIGMKSCHKLLLLLVDLQKRIQLLF